MHSIRPVRFTYNSANVLFRHYPLFCHRSSSEQIEHKNVSKTCSAIELMFLFIYMEGTDTCTHLRPTLVLVRFIIRVLLDLVFSH